ncbi:MAG: thioredoxin [Muribaculum sp.]|nr:thioredoxin [Muribaculum sp.]
MKKLILCAAAVAISAMSFAMSAQEAEKVKEINETRDLEDVFNYRNDSTDMTLARPVVVDFWAPWCAPCLRLAPVIEELAQKYGDKVDFYKMNIDENQQVAQDLRISSIPLVVFFPAGSHPFKGAVGVQPAEVYENAIKEMIAQQEADASAQ